MSQAPPHPSRADLISACRFLADIRGHMRDEREPFCEGRSKALECLIQAEMAILKAIFWLDGIPREHQ